MIIITDRSRLLNLNHFAIYLMLKPNEIAQYGVKLKGLNRYSTVTKGIFQFYIVEKGNTPYEKLPEEMIRNMRHFNVMVRLVNTIRFTYCYGIELIDLETGIHSIVEQLKVFVENVCNEDIVHLDILSQRNTITSRAAIKYYRDNNIVKEMFEAAKLPQIKVSFTFMGISRYSVIDKSPLEELELMMREYGNAPECRHHR